MALDIQSVLNGLPSTQQLEADYSSSTSRLLADYQRRIQPLRTQSNVLFDEIAQLENVEAADVQRMKGYRDLLSSIETEMDGFGRSVDYEASTLETQASTTGDHAALEMTLALAGAGAALIRQLWQRGPDSGQRYSDNPTFRQRMASFGENAKTSAESMLLSSISGGAGAFDQWFTVPYAWALNSTGTIQMWAFRQRNHESYRANPNVVSGWMWWASLGDPRTCMACVLQHGTKHTNDETLNDHHRGRCTPLPIVIGSTWVNDVQTGADWLNEQPEGLLRQMMGGALYNAWQAGAITLDQMSHVHADEVYGDMRTEASLISILGEQASQYYVRNWGKSA